MPEGSEDALTSIGVLCVGVNDTGRLQGRILPQRDAGRGAGIESLRCVKFAAQTIIGAGHVAKHVRERYSKRHIF